MSQKAAAARKSPPRLTAGAAFHKPGKESEYFLRGMPGYRAYGRLVWSFHLGGGPYIDLSVTPGPRSTVLASADAFGTSIAVENPIFLQQAAIKTMRRVGSTATRTFSLRGGAWDYPTHTMKMNNFQGASCAGDTLTSYYEISERMG